MRVEEVMRSEVPMKKDMLRVEGTPPIVFFRAFTDLKTV